MSDNSQEPKIFYAKKQNPKSRQKSQSRDSRKFSDKKRTSSNSDSRIETFKPKKHTKKPQDSPWQNRVRSTEQAPSFKGETNKTVDLDLLQKQRKEELFIYGENSCKAVFQYRPESIVKAFFTENKAHLFKGLITTLVEQRLGYDIVSDEQMSKLTQTSHHGGVCLIVKKRAALLVADYLEEYEHLKQDAVLVADDINNPHNLGGIARTAAFFDINGMMLRQTALLDSSAAHRVSEGGCESLTPIKTDDLVVAIDRFKRANYQIVMLLPCKTNNFKSENLVKSHFKQKVVFIISQQINTQLTRLADKVVYLPGSDVMPALNISVLTGILLSFWKNQKEGKR